MKSKVFILVAVCFFLYCCEQTATSPDSDSATTPTIDSFSASPLTIKRGENTTLSWSVSNCTRVEINQGIGDVGFSGSMTVEPRDTTTFRLTAYNDSADAYRECEVEVENGADVRMVSEPKWDEGEWTIEYIGKVRNYGIWTARDTAVCVYLYYENGDSLTHDCDPIVDFELKPGETSSYIVDFWDPDKKLRNKVDKSRTTFGIEWEEDPF